ATPSGFSDADGDPLAYHYQWARSTNAGSTFTDVSGQTGTSYTGTQNHGDVMQVRTWADDGQGGLSGNVFDQVTIQNTPPVAGSVAMSPSNPTSSSATLTATPSGFTDADNDSLSYAYQWQKQAGGIGSFTNVGTNSATLSGPFTRGDVYQVVATAND